jgi:threonine dehydratase
MNAVLKYMEEEPEEEKHRELNLITHSSGNFAQAVCSVAECCFFPNVTQAKLHAG